MFQGKTKREGREGRAPKVIPTPLKVIPVTFQNGVSSLSTYLVIILVQKHHRMKNRLIPAIGGLLCSYRKERDMLGSENCRKLFVHYVAHRIEPKLST